MAEHLARIIGTEEDRVNCPFFWKIGACRHGDQCSRTHYKPSAAQTLVIRHMYQNPPVAIAIAEGQMISDELLDKAADHFEEFFEEVFLELMKYGEIEDMVVCDNIGDHIIGNVYIKYSDESAACRAVTSLSGRYYGGRPIQCEYTPVTDFREARCRQFVEGQCRRGGYCNFMHIKHVPRSLRRKLMTRMYQEFPEYKKRIPHRSGSPYKRKRQTSEERRDMIEQWNRERESKNNYWNFTIITLFYRIGIFIELDMVGIGAGYDLSVSTFSPDGRVFQVEYATKAVDSAPTAVAVVFSDGIVFAADSLACGAQDDSPYANVLQAKPAWRVFAIDERMGAAVAGLLPDAKCVVKRAQEECKSFSKEYGTKPPVRIIAERVALFVHAYTLYWHVRPFGVSILLAGVNDNNTYELYCIEGSGACYKYGGMAIGKGKHIAKTEIEKLNLKEKKCKESLKDICYIISQCRDEGSLKTSDVQMAWICTDSNFTFQIIPQELINLAKNQATQMNL